MHMWKRKISIMEPKPCVPKFDCICLRNMKMFQNTQTDKQNIPVSYLSHWNWTELALSDVTVTHNCTMLLVWRGKLDQPLHLHPEIGGSYYICCDFPIDILISNIFKQTGQKNVKYRDSQHLMTEQCRYIKNIFWTQLWSHLFYRHIKLFFLCNTWSS